MSRSVLVWVGVRFASWLCRLVFCFILVNIYDFSHQQYVLKPVFTNELIGKLDSSGDMSRAFDGTLYLPGTVIIKIVFLLLHFCYRSVPCQGKNQKTPSQTDFMQSYSKNLYISTYIYGLSMIKFLLALHNLAKFCIGEVK